MKKKTAALLSSCAAIAVCSSLIVGSTYALFTSESKVNIAVTSGKVEVVANIGDVTTYSMGVAQDNGAFENGGFASVDGNVVTIDRITPGDAVEIPVSVTNNSNVNILYNTVVAFESQDELSGGLELSVSGDGEVYENIVSYTSAWQEYEEGAVTTVKVSLPTTVGNEYQDLNTKISIAVSAVQANGQTAGAGKDVRYRGVNYVSTADALTEALSNGGEIGLTDDIQLTDVSDTVISENTVLELRGYSLTTVQGASFTVKNGGVLSVRNGELNMSRENVQLAAVYVEKGSTLNLDGVEMNTNCFGVYAYGQGSTVSVKNSKLTSDNAATISTNAGTAENYNVIIDVENSTLVGVSGMLINVPCKVTISNCIIEASFQGVVARGGDITITDSVISNINNDGSFANYFESKNWGDGNMVNLAALTIGNKGNSYQYPTTVRLINTVVESTGAYPTVYMYGNTSEGNGATLYYDEDSKVGEVIQGDNGANTYVNP